jgi:hypothetical protein
MENEENIYYDLQETINLIEVNALILNKLENELVEVEAEFKKIKEKEKNLEEEKNNLLNEVSFNNNLEVFFEDLKKEFKYEDEKIAKRPIDQIKAQTKLINDFLKSIKNSDFIFCQSCKKKFDTKKNSEKECLCHFGNYLKNKKCRKCKNKYRFSCCNLCYDCSEGCSHNFHIPLFLI